MKVALHLIKNYGVTYEDGTVIAWADLMLDEPEFVLPDGAERVEYLPGERLSYFANGTQYGDAKLGAAWTVGDRILARKAEYIANAKARQPAPPPPDPPVANTKIADAKVAIDTYLIDPLADAKMKIVLTKIREAL